MSHRPSHPIHPAQPGIPRVFVIVWLGQLVSTLGSGLTGFALSLWVYQATGSITSFALLALSGVLPRLLLSPLAGHLVDRWDRKRTMLVSDLGSGLCTLAAAGLLYWDRLEIWPFYVVTALSAAFNTFQAPAYTASVVLLAPPNQLGRANGLVQLAQSIADLVTPLLAGFLVMAIQIWGVILIDFATFLFAVASLAMVRIPRPAPVPAAGRPSAAPDGFWKEAAAGWRFIAVRPGFIALLGFFAVFRFIWGMVGALAAPLALSFTTPAGLGVLMTAAGAGMLAGSLAMSAWGGPRRRVVGLLAAELAGGLGFVVMGLRPELLPVAVGAFFAHATIAVIAGSNRTLWQTRVPAGMQGRVFAIQEMVSNSTAPLALLAAGPLAERLFMPLLLPGGPLAGSLGLVTGTGSGRGIGLLFVCLGLVKGGTALAGLLYPRLRRLEEEHPALQ